MFDIGWTELLVIGVVALIVVGPKDLPIMFRRLGQLTAKARGMAREFQRAMDQAADESGVKDVSRDLKTMTSAKNLGLDRLKDAARDVTSLEPGSASGGSKSAGAESATGGGADAAPAAPAAAPVSASADVSSEKAGEAKTSG